MIARSAGVRFAAALAIVLGFGAMAGCSTSSRAIPGNEVPDRLATPQPDEQDPQKRARARTDLAAAYFGRGQMPTALEQVKLAIAADPNYGEAYNLRGLIYSNLGENALAEESFKRALQINPRDGDTYHNYGWYLCQMRRHGEANAMFTQALSITQYRGVPRTLVAQGVCQAHAGQLAEAEASLTRAYEIDPGSPVAATNLAEVLYRRGEFERARFYIRRVNAQREVANAQTLWLATRIEMKMGNRQGASEFGSQLRSRFPDSREALAYARSEFDE